jgi:PII-like signaling protein
LPIVIQIVDTAAKIEAFRPRLDAMVTGGLVTVEDVGVLIYSPATPEQKGK